MPWEWPKEIAKRQKEKRKRKGKRKLDVLAIRHLRYKSTGILVGEGLRSKWKIFGFCLISFSFFLVSFFFFLFFFFFFCHIQDMWKFPDHGSNPHHSRDESCTDNTGSLTHWTVRELSLLNILSRKWNNFAGKFYLAFLLINVWLQGFWTFIPCYIKRTY